jgi:hypothetical protein
MDVSLNKTRKNSAILGVDYYVSTCTGFPDVGYQPILNQQVAAQDRVTRIHRD